jgi:hypothetical protein
MSLLRSLGGARRDRCEFGVNAGAMFGGGSERVENDLGSAARWSPWLDAIVSMICARGGRIVSPLQGFGACFCDSQGLAPLAIECRPIRG